MLVRYWMSQPVIHIGPKDSMQQAIALMIAERHLSV